MTLLILALALAIHKAPKSKVLEILMVIGIGACIVLNY